MSAKSMRLVDVLNVGFVVDLWRAQSLDDHLDVYVMDTN